MVTVTTPTSIKFSPSCLRLTVSSSILLYHCSSLEHDNTSSPACILDRLGADSLYDCNDSCNEVKSLELEHSCTCNNNNNNNNNNKIINNLKYLSYPCVCVCVYQQYKMYNSITSIIIIIILTVNSAGDTQLDTVTNTGSVGRVAIGQSLMVRE